MIIATVKRQAAAVAAVLMAGAANAQGITKPLEAVDVFVEATARGDAEAIAALYGPDAILLVPGAPMLSGRDVIQKIHERNFAAGANEIVFTDVKMDDGPNEAKVIWEWVSTITPKSGDQIVQRGRSLVLFERRSGGWLISVDMFQQGPPLR